MRAAEPVNYPPCVSQWSNRLTEGGRLADLLEARPSAARAALMVPKRIARLVEAGGAYRPLSARAEAAVDYVDDEEDWTDSPAHQCAQPCTQLGEWLTDHGGCLKAASGCLPPDREPGKSI